MSTDRPPQQAVGGQAVIEGVMMRTPSASAVAVRRPDGSIVVRHRPWRSLTARNRILGLPFVRGMAVLVESLSGGMDALRFSAEAAAGEQVGPGSGSSAGQGRGARLTANLALLLGVLLALLLFKGAPHGVALWIGLDPTQPLFHVVDGVVKLLLVVGYITAISRMKDIQRVFEYHGAEHKSIRTFELERELTVASTRGQSRLHPRCGTSFIVVVVLASMLVYIALSPLIPRTEHGGLLFQLALLVVKVLLLAPVAAVAYEVNRLAGRHWQSPVARAVAWPGMLMQRLLTTREPSDDEIEVALVALRVALAEETGQGPAEVGWRLDDWESFAAFEAEAKPIPGAAEVLGSERAA